MIKFKHYEKVTKEEEIEMFTRLNKAREQNDSLLEKEIIDEIFHKYQYLISIHLHNKNLCKIALSHKGYNAITEDDLYNIAAEGLLKSIRAFNIENGFRLNTYSNKKIFGHVIDYIRKNSPHTRNMLKIKKEVNTFIDEYIIQNHEVPSKLILLRTFGKKNMDIYDRIPSINQNMSSKLLANVDSNNIVNDIYDVQDKTDNTINVEQKLEIEGWLQDDKYTETEQIIILLKICYFTDLEIASYMNYCASRVSQVISGIRQKNGKLR